MSYVESDGTPRERIQYYHRAVGCQIVSAPVKSILAIVWLPPGEGEYTAALRLFRRIAKLYGSRFFDILLSDSLYAQAPVLGLAQELGWDVVIALKQERRELYQNAMGLFQGRPADHDFERRQEGEYRPGTTVRGGGSPHYPRLSLTGAGRALRGRSYAPENSRGQALPANHSPTVALDQHSGEPSLPRPTDLATRTSPLEKRE
jgi:hypothetical protein